MVRPRAIKRQDKTARQESPIANGSEILFLNEGSFPAYTPFFIIRLANLQQGMKLDGFTDQMVCKAVMRTLSAPRTKETVKATVKRLF